PGTVARSVEVLVHGKMEIVVRRVGQMAAREHSDTVAIVVGGVVAGGLQHGSPAGSKDVRAVRNTLDLHRGKAPSVE
ncbi:MAG: hypothetical protein ACK56I_30095, partial [bacterium]